MEQRRGMQHAGARRAFPGAGKAQGIGQRGAVREHDALGPPGGSAGVEDHRQIVAVPQMAGRSAMPRRWIADRGAVRRRRVPRQNVAQARCGGPDAPGDGMEGLPGDQDADSAVVQRERDFRHCPARVERDQDRTGPQHAEQRGHEIVGVRRQQRDAIAGRDAKVGQLVRQMRCAFVHFPPGARTRAIYRRHGIGPFAQRAMEHLAEIVADHGDCPLRCPLSARAER